MKQEQQNKKWLVLGVAIVGAAGVICVTLIVIGLPFAKRLAENYLPGKPTGLVLKFDGTLEGADGERGYGKGVLFAPGYDGQGVLFNEENSLHYYDENNIDPQQGSIEFWVKPFWDGDDGRDYVFFEIGDTWFNRFRITKDGANNFRFMVWSSDTEFDAACNVSGWTANSWHKVIAIWQHDHIALYLDDGLCDTETSVVLPSSLGPRLYIGSSAQQDLQAQAVIDEFIIRTHP